MCNKMSDVRLSNASPTVERVDARQPDNVRPSVRRNLFGRPDPGEIRRDAEASIREGVRDFTEMYNFDPVNDRPLSSGNFQWQLDRDAPEFFSRQPHGSQPPQRDEDLPGDNTRQDAETSRGGQEPERDASRKRRSGPSGSCSSECQSKRSHTDEEDDDEDQSDGAGSQAATAAAANRPSRPEQSAEVQ